MLIIESKKSDSQEKILKEHKVLNVHLPLTALLYETAKFPFVLTHKIVLHFRNREPGTLNKWYKNTSFNPNTPV